ncbi:hypothetical protein GCM10027259_14430 [Micromonospora palomenae]
MLAELSLVTVNFASYPLPQLEVRTKAAVAADAAGGATTVAATRAAASATANVATRGERSFTVASRDLWWGDRPGVGGVAGPQEAGRWRGRTGPAAAVAGGADGPAGVGRVRTARPGWAGCGRTGRGWAGWCGVAGPRDGGPATPVRAGWPGAA